MGSYFVQESGHARTADTANKATLASKATEAEKAETANKAINATYAQISKEAERLNFGGTMVYIDPSGHYIIFTAPNMDLNQSIMIDVVNRNILNVNAIADIDGNVICPVAQPDPSPF
jgi:hypothetical protein